MAEKKERYTDAMLYNDLVQIVDAADLEEAKRNAIIEKLLKKQEQVAKRAEYSKEHRKPTASKVTEATKAIAAEIGAILTDTPMTTAEINEILGTDYTALRVANAAKFIPGAVTAKVVRPTVNKAGLRSEKDYTAYFLA